MKDRKYFRVALMCALVSVTSLVGCVNVSQQADTASAAPASADDKSLVELWSAGQTAFGYYMTHMDFTVQAGRDLAENPLLDFAFLNLEQDYAVESARDVAEGLRSGGGESAMDLLVRIPPMSEAGVEISRARVNELLALNVDGVVFPHVKSAEEARTAVSFFEDVNVWSPANPDGDFVVMLLLESPEVFAELEEIANIPGYSSLACGIGSLTGALDGDRAAAEKLSLELLAQSQRAGMVDLITADPDSVELRVNQGFRALIVYGPKADETIRIGRVASGR